MYCSLTNDRLSKHSDIEGILLRKISTEKQCASAWSKNSKDFQDFEVKKR
ncbi:unnamed protein product [Brugia timori]|uniref:Uncharacterized protein n=1 Tax=Brugia timori TaxID=42155 RepID=A0A0R3QWQ3_9BILA|nr:unnamed protein product [Brugia timori]